MCIDAAHRYTIIVIASFFYAIALWLLILMSQDSGSTTYHCPYPEQKSYSNYSNEYNNLHKYLQEIANANIQNTDFLSTNRTIKDSHKQPMSYLILGTKNINGFAILDYIILTNLPKSRNRFIREDEKIFLFFSLLATRFPI